MGEVKLPAITSYTSTYLDEITRSLKVPRDIIASDDEIQEAWNRLPRIMAHIPPELITKGIAKMCIAIASGLFDSGISYIWNESIVELRNKVKRFGLGIVGEITERREFDEGKLNELQDSDLLSLCLKLNLITEDGFFYLDQCRDIRNNFSAAHPTIGEIDENELLNFTNRCVKYALSNDINPIGVNIGDFIKSLKLSKFNEEQLKTWCDKLKQTHEAQRVLLFGTLYGVYCDPESTEESRVNALNIFLSLKEHITPSIRSNLILSHQEYVIKGNERSTSASQQFLEKINLLELLGEKERHIIIFKACKNLMSAHDAMNNFYNEPPFAERLLELTTGNSVPESTQEYFVESIAICGMGNGYGVSNAAFPFYRKIVSNFSPKEIDIFFKMIEDSGTAVGTRLSWGGNRRGNLKLLISGIDSSSVPISSKGAFEKWIK